MLLAFAFFSPNVFPVAKVGGSSSNGTGTYDSSVLFFIFLSSSPSLSLLIQKNLSINRYVRNEKERERETDVTIVDIGFLYIYPMDVCANVLYIRLLLLLPHNCHDTTTTRWWPSFSFFSFPFRCSRGSVIYPPTTVVNGPDSRGQCTWRIKKKREGAFFIWCYGRVAAASYITSRYY